jgi:peptidoglycan-associated lipoprotein
MPLLQYLLDGVHNMKKFRLVSVLVSTAFLVLAGCSSHRGAGSGAAVNDGTAGGAGADGAYAQGVGGAGGYQPSASCNVPQVQGFKTESFYFDFDKNDVHNEDMSRLQSLAQSAAANNGGLRVVGNTDDRGSREYNMALGWRRANAVTALLKQSGVSAKQVTTNSNGAEKPIAFGTSEEDFQCNRRVDVIYR